VTLIDTEEGARRLARVILSDIEIYNKEKIRARGNLRPELEEGYALFRSRVAPALVPLFSQVVKDRWPGQLAKPAAIAIEPTVATPVAPPPPAPPPSPVRMAALPPPALPPPPARVAPAPPVAAAPPPPPAPPVTLTAPREAARRLARVMLARIQLGDRPDGGRGLAADIEEARTMFQSCVIPELRPIFDEALAELPVPIAGDDRTEPQPPPDAMEMEGSTAVDVEDEPPTNALPREPVPLLPPPLPPVAPPPVASLPVAPAPVALDPAPLPPLATPAPGGLPAKTWLLMGVATLATTAGLVYFFLAR